MKFLITKFITSLYVIEEEAQKIWNEKTDFGKKDTTYADIDYYKIFPADTNMLYS